MLEGVGAKAQSGIKRKGVDRFLGVLRPRVWEIGHLGCSYGAIFPSKTKTELVAWGLEAWDEEGDEEELFGPLDLDGALRRDGRIGWG